MKAKLYCIILFLLLVLPAYPEFFRNLNLSNGLSNLSVMSICQDKLGRMWFGTKEGINMYDGYEIQSYKGWVKDEKGSLLWMGNDINPVHEGCDGNIYFLSDDNLFCYDINKESFKKITPKASIQSFTVSSGYIWYIDGDSLYKRPYDEDKSHAIAKSPYEQINTMGIFSDGRLYVGTKDGLFVSSNDGKTEYKHFLPGVEIYSLFESKNKELWLGSRMDGIYRKDADGMFYKVADNQYFPTGGKNSLQIRNFVEDADGDVWFGTFSGLMKYDAGNGTFHKVDIPKYLGGLSHPSVFSLYKDKQGLVWVGSYYGGVSCFCPNEEEFIHYNFQILSKEATYFSLIGDIIKDQRGNLWISTDGGGISCVDGNWNVIEQYTANPPRGLPHNNIKSIVYDSSSDCIFIATYLGGLSRYDIKNKTFYTYKWDKHAVKPTNVIYSLKIWNGNLYLTSQNGFFMMDPNTGLITMLSPYIRYCETFDIDENGNAYFVNWNSIRYSGLQNTIDIKTMDFKGLNVKGRINRICATGKGLYICTLGSGLFYYDKSTGDIMQINKSNSDIPSDYCYNMKQVDSDSFVLTTDNGVSLFVPKENKFSTITLDPENSLMNACGIYVSPGGDIYIGDTKGVSFFRKTSFDNSNGFESSLYFSRLYINNQLITPCDKNKILGRALPFTERLDLKHFQNNLVIGFSHSDYKHYNGKYIFEYKLDGFDDGWIETTLNEIHYTNLNPGHYTLYVRPQGYPDKVIDLSVCIALPWYKTWWAISLYITMSISVVIYFVQNRMAKRILAISLEKERFEKQHIESMNHEKLVFFTNISHEFRTPLTLIINHIDTLLKNQLPVQLYSKIVKVKKNAQYMNNLVTELLDFRKFSQDNVTLHITETDMCLFLKEVYLSFSDYAKQRNIKYGFYPDRESVHCWVDIKQMEKVFFNLLSNAFKYTPDGKEISVRVYIKEKCLIVDIEDNGIGIQENDIPHIFDTFFQGNNVSSNYSKNSTGIGLALTKAIVEKHHGSVDVRSVVNSGSVFTVQLPMGKDVFEVDPGIEFVEEPNQEILSSDFVEDNMLLPEIPLPDDNVLLDDGSEVVDSGGNKKYSILVVEDNVELQQVLKQVFAAYYNVITASNGNDGYNAVLKYKPDVVISDIMMPVMNGTEMCLKIKNNIDLCHIPVILLTALNSDEQNIEGLNRGADDYITKPFNSDILIARTNNLLRNRLLIQHKIKNEPIGEIDLTSINPLDQELLSKVSDIIEKHIDDMNFDIPRLCLEIGMGRSQLYSKFKSITGMTPNNFLLNYRLKHAASLLKNYPSLSIADISDKCGFNSPIYFSRCFKNQYGQTPQCYRKENKLENATGKEQ